MWHKPWTEKEEQNSLKFWRRPYSIWKISFKFSVYIPVKAKHFASGFRPHLHPELEFYLLGINEKDFILAPLSTLITSHVNASKFHLSTEWRVLSPGSIPLTRCCSGSEDHGRVNVFYVPAPSIRPWSWPWMHHPALCSQPGSCCSHRAVLGTGGAQDAHQEKHKPPADQRTITTSLQTLFRPIFLIG